MTFCIGTSFKKSRYKCVVLNKSFAVGSVSPGYAFVEAELEDFVVCPIKANMGTEAIVQICFVIVFASRFFDFRICHGTL